jgi:hypothetical protein
MFLNESRIQKIHSIIIIIVIINSLHFSTVYWKYINVSETIPVCRVHNVTGISWSQYVEYIMLFLTVKGLCFILVGLLADVVPQGLIWPFSEIHLCRTVQVYCSDYFLNESEMVGIASTLYHFTNISTSTTFVSIFYLRLGLYVLKYFRLISFSKF